MQLYDKVSFEECWRNTGTGPISTKWIDINMGDDTRVNYRSINVTRGIAHSKQDGLFAATLPLEVLKLLFSQAKRTCAADSTSACTASEMLSPTCPGSPRRGSNALGFTMGKATPGVFLHASEGLRAYVHGDDFLLISMPKELPWMQRKIEEKCKLKVEMLGLDKNSCKEFSFLDRVLRWTDEGIEYESGPGHVGIKLKELICENCKAVTTPGTKDEGYAKEGVEAAGNFVEKLDDMKHSVYRALVARTKLFTLRASRRGQT